MGQAFLNIDRFDFGTLLQGQMIVAKFKILKTRLLLFLEIWDM